MMQTTRKQKKEIALYWLFAVLATPIAVAGASVINSGATFWSLVFVYGVVIAVVGTVMTRRILRRNR